MPLTIQCNKVNLPLCLSFTRRILILVHNCAPRRTGPCCVRKFSVLIVTKTQASVHKFNYCNYKKFPCLLGQEEEVLQTHKELSSESSYFLERSRWELKIMRKERKEVTRNIWTVTSRSFEDWIRRLGRSIYPAFYGRKSLPEHRGNTFSKVLFLLNITDPNLIITRELQFISSVVPKIFWYVYLQISSRLSETDILPYTRYSVKVHCSLLLLLLLWAG